MRKYLIGLLAALVMALLYSCDTMENLSEPDLDYFVKYYGGDGHQYGVDMLALEDGSFILLGNYSVDIEETNIYLVRVDPEGEVLWEKRIGKNGTIWSATDIELTQDGNLILVADFQEGVGSQRDVKLFRISAEGTALDSVIYSTPANDFSRSVTSLADGGFLVSGYTEFTATYNLAGEPDPDLGDVFNIRVDADLEHLNLSDWSPVNFGFGSNLDVAVKGVQRPDGTFYIFGYTNSTLTGNLNPNERLGLFYFERNAVGSLGKVFYPGNIVNVNDTQINFLGPAPAELGGGLVVIGTSVNMLQQSEIFMAKMRNALTFSSASNDATFYNTVALGRNIRGVSACPSLTGEFGYLVLGNEVRAIGATNIWLSKVNQNGAVLWSTTFGSELEDDFGAAVTQLPDGKIMVLGTMGLGDNQFKMALIKLNAEGQFLK